VTPANPMPGEPLQVEGGAVNRGREPVEAGAIALRVEAAREAAPRETLGLAALPFALAVGESAAFSIPAVAPAAEGKLLLVATLIAAGDGNAADDADSLPLRVGHCPLALSEIQFHPAGGEGEWVEVLNRSGAVVDLASFTLSDAGGSPGRPAPGGLPPESLAVLVQDRAALLARFPRLDTTRVLETRPWSSLNNHDEADGLADAVLLRESDGTPCDRHDYSATGIAAGVTIERRDGGWWPARSADGTPLEPPRRLAPPAGRFEVRPRLLRAGAATARCRWSLPWPRARVRFEVLDLLGRRVPGGLAEFLAPGLGEQDVSLDGLEPGLYAIVLRARRDGGVEEITELSPLRIVGSNP